jgi:hypothetical protein
MNNTIPQPPKKPSRKRPCVKQSGRRRDARDAVSQGDRAPKQRKLNRYFLDPTNLRVVPVYPKVTIPEGVRLIEQPADLAAPSIQAFFDASLLPAGATLTSRYGVGTADLDPALVERFSRLSSLAGVGRQRRSSNLDALSRCVDADAALRAAIVALGGEAALSLPIEQLSADGRSADDVQAALILGVTAGNNSTAHLAADLPERLEVSELLRTALAHLPGRVLAVSTVGSGSRIELRCHRKEDADKIVAALRGGGARYASAKRFKREVDGKTERGFTVRGDFNVSAAELAAARAGSTPRLAYRVNTDGRVEAFYSVQLFDLEVATPAFRAPATRGAVSALANHLLAKNPDASPEENSARLDVLEIGFQVANVLAATRTDFRANDYQAGLVEALGPVTSLEAARARLAGKTANDFLDPVAVARYEDRFEQIELPSFPEDTWPIVIYEQGAARANLTALRLTDPRLVEMPTTIEGPSGEVPVTITEVTFVESKGRTQVRSRAVPVADVLARQAAFLARHEPRAALLLECRDAAVAKGALAMAHELGEERPDGAAKARVRNGELSHYLSRDGGLILLIENLAQSPALGETGAQWQTWCADQLNARRNRFFRALSKIKDLPEDERRTRRAEITRQFETDFWAGLPRNEQHNSSQILVGAATAMAASRLGDKVTSDDALEMAQELATAVGAATETVYARGRALFLADRDGTATLL